MRSVHAGPAASDPPDHRRCGYTLIELLVALSIVCLFAALLLPAIGDARESAVRAKCLNNLRQLSLAHVNYTGLHGVFPSADGYFSGRPGDPRLYSAFAQLLPMLDRNPEFNAINFSLRLVDQVHLNPITLRIDPVPPANLTAFSSRIDVFLCPGDPSPFPSSVYAGENYRANLGASPPTQRKLELGGPFARIGIVVGPANVGDGLSNTAAFSERTRGGARGAAFIAERDILTARMSPGLDPIRAIEDCAYQDVSHPQFRCCAGATWAIGSLSQTAYNHLPVPNSRVPDCALDYFMPIEGRVSARSYHLGLVDVTFADGSARSVRDAINPAVWKSLGTIAGNDLGTIEE